MTKHHYGDDWFSCESCGGDFEHFNQVQDQHGQCEGCATLTALLEIEKRVEAKRGETE